MPNTFVNPSAVIRDANLYLNDQLLVAQLVNRNVEQTFASKVGSTVKVKSIPNLGSADEFTSTTSATNVVENYKEVEIEKHFYKRVDLTSDESTLQVDDFTSTIVVPAVRSLIRGVESYMIQKIVGGFNVNAVGTAGNSPSTHAHILAADKKIFDNRGDNSGLVGLITSTAHASFAALNVFTSMDYGVDRPMGLKSNSLGMLSGINWFRSPNAAFTRGDIAGTVLVDGTVASGTTIHIDGFTAATGTVEEGTRFVIQNDATVYTVVKKAVIANNECDITITPTLAAQADDGETITFQSAPSANVVFNPMGVSGAILPGAVIGPQTAASIINGIGLRIISDVSTTSLSGSWVFDLYCGCRVTMPEFGAVMQG